MALQEASQVIINLAGETSTGTVPRTNSSPSRINWVGFVHAKSGPTLIKLDYTVKKEHLLVVLDIPTCA